MTDSTDATATFSDGKSLDGFTWRCSWGFKQIGITMAMVQNLHKLGYNP